MTSRSTTLVCLTICRYHRRTINLTPPSSPLLQHDYSPFMEIFQDGGRRTICRSSLLCISGLPRLGHRSSNHNSVITDLLYEMAMTVVRRRLSHVTYIQCLQLQTGLKSLKVSKTLNMIVNRPLPNHFEKLKLFPDVQSANRRGHSTETVVIKVYSDLVDAISNGKLHFEYVYS